MVRVEDKAFMAPPCMMDREKVSERMPRRGRSYEKRRCSEGKLWIFLAWGIVVVVFGLVIGGIFFNLRALTTSSNYTEVIPTYVNAVSAILSGVLVLILFWKRNVVLVFCCVFVNVGTAFLNGISAILSGTLIIPPLQSFLHCTFLEEKKECHCLSPYSQSSVHLDYSDDAPATLIFKQTSSCHNVEVTLLQTIYALCGLCVVSSIVCVIAAILALLVMRMERQRKRTFQDMTYDEIFTISNSNTPDSSDSENEQNISNMLNHPMLPCYGDLDNTVPESDQGSCKLRSTLQRSHSLKQPNMDRNNLDLVGSTTTSEKGNTTGKSKLKEHRRRDRRAVTLHNLDSKQLMLILSLQMRYLKENENSKSQVELSAKKLDEQLRRSFTPQPYHSRSRSCDSDRDVRKVRSHTPQPYQTARKQQTYENAQELNASNLNDFYENNIPPWERNQPVPKTPKLTASNEKRKSNYIPHYEEIDDVASYMSTQDEEENRIYSNQSEIKSQKKKKTKPLVSVDSEESESSDIPSHCVRRSSHRNRTMADGNLPNNIPVPSSATIPLTPSGRPKSYINAIDNMTNENKPDALYSQVQSTRSQSLVPHSHSQPVLLHHGHPTKSGTLPCRSVHPAEDIYAQPRKKTNVVPAFQRIPDSASVPIIGRIPDGSDRRSAFQVVQRSSEAGTGVVGFINPVTNSNIAMYPVMERRKGSEAPPPYSPPPCYNDCFSNSRDSSLKSSSSSSHSANLTDMYGKVQKQKPKFVYAQDPGRPLPPYPTTEFPPPPPPVFDYGQGQCYANEYGNIENYGNRHYNLQRDLDQLPLPPPPSQYQTNYVINLNEEQPRVAAQGESSDSDEMETVI